MPSREKLTKDQIIAFRKDFLNQLYRKYYRSTLELQNVSEKEYLASLQDKINQAAENNSDVDLYNLGNDEANNIIYVQKAMLDYTGSQQAKEYNKVLLKAMEKEEGVQAVVKTAVSKLLTFDLTRLEKMELQDRFDFLKKEPGAQLLLIPEKVRDAAVKLNIIKKDSTVYKYLTDNSKVFKDITNFENFPHDFYNQKETCSDKEKMDIQVEAIALDETAKFLKLGGSHISASGIYHNHEKALLGDYMQFDADGITDPSYNISSIFDFSSLAEEFHTSAKELKSKFMSRMKAPMMREELTSFGIALMLENGMPLLDAINPLSRVDEKKEIGKQFIRKIMNPNNKEPQKDMLKILAKGIHYFDNFFDSYFSKNKLANTSDFLKQNLITLSGAFLAYTLNILADHKKEAEKVNKSLGYKTDLDSIKDKWYDNVNVVYSSIQTFSKIENDTREGVNDNIHSDLQRYIIAITMLDMGRKDEKKIYDKIMMHPPFDDVEMYNYISDNVGDAIQTFMSKKLANHESPFADYKKLITDYLELIEEDSQFEFKDVINQVRRGFLIDTWNQFEKSWEALEKADNKDIQKLESYKKVKAYISTVKMSMYNVDGEKNGTMEVLGEAKKLKTLCRNFINEAGEVIQNDDFRFVNDLNIASQTMKNILEEYGRQDFNIEVVEEVDEAEEELDDEISAENDENINNINNIIEIDNNHREENIMADGRNEQPVAAGNAQPAAGNAQPAAGNAPQEITREKIVNDRIAFLNSFYSAIYKTHDNLHKDSEKEYLDSKKDEIRNIANLHSDVEFYKLSEQAEIYAHRFSDSVARYKAYAPENIINNRILRGMYDLSGTPEADKYNIALSKASQTEEGAKRITAAAINKVLSFDVKRLAKMTTWEKIRFMLNEPGAELLFVTNILCSEGLRYGILNEQSEGYKQLTDNAVLYQQFSSARTLFENTNKPEICLALAVKDFSSTDVDENKKKLYEETINALPNVLDPKERAKIGDVLNASESKYPDSYYDGYIRTFKEQEDGILVPATKGLYNQKNALPISTNLSKEEKLKLDVDIASLDDLNIALNMGGIPFDTNAVGAKGEAALVGQNAQNFLDRDSFKLELNAIVLDKAPAEGENAEDSKAKILRARICQKLGCIDNDREIFAQFGVALMLAQGMTFADATNPKSRVEEKKDISTKFFKKILEATPEEALKESARIIAYATDYMDKYFELYFKRNPYTNMKDAYKPELANAALNFTILTTNINGSETELHKYIAKNDPQLAAKLKKTTERWSEITSMERQIIKPKDNRGILHSINEYIKRMTFFDNASMSIYDYKLVNENYPFNELNLEEIQDNIYINEEVEKYINEKLDSADNIFANPQKILEQYRKNIRIGNNSKFLNPYEVLSDIRLGYMLEPVKETQAALENLGQAVTTLNNFENYAPFKEYLNDLHEEILQFDGDFDHMANVMASICRFFDTGAKLTNNISASANNLENAEDKKIVDDAVAAVVKSMAHVREQFDAYRLAELKNFGVEEINRRINAIDNWRPSSGRRKLISEADQQIQDDNLLRDDLTDAIELCDINFTENGSDEYLAVKEAFKNFKESLDSRNNEKIKLEAQGLKITAYNYLRARNPYMGTGKERYRLIEKVRKIADFKLERILEAEREAEHEAGQIKDDDSEAEKIYDAELRNRAIEARENAEKFRNAYANNNVSLICDNVPNALEKLADIAAEEGCHERFKDENGEYRNLLNTLIVYELCTSDNKNYDNNFAKIVNEHSPKALLDSMKNMLQPLYEEFMNDDHAISKYIVGSDVEFRKRINALVAESAKENKPEAGEDVKGKAKGKVNVEVEENANEKEIDVSKFDAAKMDDILENRL